MSPRIEPIRHATVDVGSDHQALLLEVEIGGVRVKLGTINLGPANVRKVIAKLLPILGRRGVLCVTEAGGQLDALLDEADVYAYRLLGGTSLPGSKSTVVLVGPEVHTRRSMVRRLLRRRFVGPGAGPSFNKPKVANGGRVEVAGVVFGVSVVHFLASQQRNRRMIYSLAMARVLIGWRHRVPWLYGGDWNSDLIRGRLWKWLARAGYTNNHTELGAIDTMRRRSIDGFVWRKSNA